MVLIPSLVLIVLLGFWLRLARTRRSKLPFPPGPRPHWIIGNLKDIPSIKPWITYAHWSKRYKSEVVYINSLGQDVVIINGLDSAIEIFEKHAHNFIDRPDVTMFRLMNWDWNLGLMPYSTRWIQQRRIYQSNLRKENVKKYQYVQVAKVQNLLRSLLESPEEFPRHIQTLTAAFSMATIYGHDIKSMDDPYVDLAEQTVAMLSASAFPGAALVNAFPILRHLPGWVPGTGFKDFANRCRVLTTRMRNEPLEDVKRRMEEGTAKPCLAVTLLEEYAMNNTAGEETIKDVAGTSYAASADTSYSAILTAFYCLASRPGVVKKGRAEIHDVLGTGRLPSTSDRPHLPFLEAIYREVMRFYPVAPLGVPRAALEDDIVGGYLIPKGAMVLANIWAMTHDPDVYEHPDEFRPERFLNPDGTLNGDDRVLAFGFGRRHHVRTLGAPRICVGRHVASSAVWLTIAALIAVFDFHPVRDENGTEIPIKTEYSDGMICHPNHFRCLVVPHSEEAARLVADVD
ncbi:cytochrome P450 [Pluteus cervinus]|uniref:Cytochrome P450 n=1 Tax=Pluteus cervinus TaxID=181527 RepID=A0ACD3B9P4_9AGAR|nr:cytochrome P450 [Pluteus cervinus]